MQTLLQHPAATALTERILSENPIGLSAARKRLGVHEATLARWIVKGIVLADGTRLRLEGVRVAGRLLTSDAALVRFVAQQQLQSSEEVVTPAELRQADRVAEAILDRAGVR